MTRIRAHEDGWDLSLIDDELIDDERNERPLRAAFVAFVVALATAFLLALV
jgi:hypothetical protein